MFAKKADSHSLHARNRASCGKPLWTASPCGILSAYEPEGISRASCNAVCGTGLTRYRGIERPASSTLKWKVLQYAIRIESRPSGSKDCKSFKSTCKSCEQSSRFNRYANFHSSSNKRRQKVTKPPADAYSQRDIPKEQRDSGCDSGAIHPKRRY